MSESDPSSISGPIFGDVGGLLRAVYWTLYVRVGSIIHLIMRRIGASLFLAGAIFGEMLGDSRSTKCYVFTIKMRLRSGKSKLGERTGRRCPFHAWIMLGTVLNGFSIGRNHSRIFAAGLRSQNFVAGTVFGDVGARQVLLRVLYWTFHIRVGFIIRLIFQSQRSIW